MCKICPICTCTLMDVNLATQGSHDTDMSSGADPVLKNFLICFQDVGKMLDVLESTSGAWFNWVDSVELYNNFLPCWKEYLVCLNEHGDIQYIHTDAHVVCFLFLCTSFLMLCNGNYTSNVAVTILLHVNKRYHNNCPGFIWGTTYTTMRHWSIQGISFHPLTITMYFTWVERGKCTY